MISNYFYIKRFKFLGGLGVLLTSITCFAADKAPPTQAQLHSINHKIQHLKKTLSTDQMKKKILNKQLLITEKKIGEDVEQLQKFTQLMVPILAQINNLEKRMSHLNQTLQHKQNIFAQSIVTRYKMGPYQPLKWLVNQNNLYSTSQLLDLYHYFIQTHQQLLANITEIKDALNAQKELSRHKLILYQQLQIQVQQHQKSLAQEKSYHQTVLQQLNYSIDNQKQTLDKYQHDKQNLTALLLSLTSEIKPTKNNYPFSSMRHKLPFPFGPHRVLMKKMNQGLAFFTEEGTPIYAIHSGKVVFSDWLKSYGLLLIIDHGEGFMTLYAHNQALFKHKGQQVSSNDVIAKCGHSGGLTQDSLYFEIRHQGKVLLPLEWFRS